MALRQEYARISSFSRGSSSMPIQMREPLSRSTPPQQRVGGSCRFPRRGSLSLPNSAEKKPFMSRSNSIACARLENSPAKLDFTSNTRKRPSLLGGKLKSSLSKETIPTASEKHSVVLLGAGGVGKTALVVRFVTGRFLNEYDPTLEMIYEKTVAIGDNLVSLDILDTAGNAEASYFKNGEGFVVVYSINDHYSFEVARQMVKLIKEVRKTDGDQQVPILLVGNKRDLRRGRRVGKDEARETASEFGCAHYETSALTNRNVQVVFLNMIFQLRFTKKSRQRTQASSVANGFLSTVRQFFNHRRGSLTSW